MQKGHNFNHPKPGSKIKVEPIKKKRDIKLIKSWLAEKPLGYALFTLGINITPQGSYKPTVLL